MKNFSVDFTNYNEEKKNKNNNISETVTRDIS